MPLRKGVYPYDYADDMSKFQESQLPPKEGFFRKAYQRWRLSARTVFTTFKLQTLGEYHGLFLLSEVFLLVDVFENFRSICLDYYGLDPAHHYTSPGLAWSAYLRMTGVELELQAVQWIKLLVGSPMPDWSRGRGLTKNGLGRKKMSAWLLNGQYAWVSLVMVSPWPY